MKMNGFIVGLLTGLVVGGCLVYRHRHRLAGTVTPAAPRSADDLRPVDVWQQSIRLAPPYNPDWRKKLRREEAKQRPQEGRN